MKIENNGKDLVVLFCAPKSQYPEPPLDVSKCRLIDCPYCDDPMWLSEKKEEIKKMAEKNSKEILLCCFDCFSLIARENKEIMKNHFRIDI